MGVTLYNHTGHCVRDLAVSRRFYEELFEFEPIFDFDASGDDSARLLRLPGPVEMDAFYLRREGFVLELLHFRAPPPTEPRPRVMNEPGLTHISVSVDDIDAFCARVPEYGGRVLDETRIPTAVFIEDPDGQLIELLAASSGFGAHLHGVPGDEVGG